MIGAPKPELVGYGVENRSCKFKKIIIVEADREARTEIGLQAVTLLQAGRPVDLMYHRFQKSITSSRNTWCMRSIREPNLRDSIIIT
jgi:hypothetical protein